MDIENLKKSITDQIDNSSEHLKDLALKIHSNPELGFNEVKAVEWLTGYLKENGFSVEMVYSDVAGTPYALQSQEFAVIARKA